MLGKPGGRKKFARSIRTDGVSMDVLHTHPRATGQEAEARAVQQASIEVSFVRACVCVCVLAWLEGYKLLDEKTPAPIGTC